MLLLCCTFSCKDKDTSTKEQLSHHIRKILDALPKEYRDKPKSPYTYLKNENYIFTDITFKELENGDS